MERLTYWNNKEKGSALPVSTDDGLDTVDLETICAKLAAYEDLGLSPEDVAGMRETIDGILTFANRGSIDQIGGSTMKNGKLKTLCLVFSVIALYVALIWILSL